MVAELQQTVRVCGGPAPSQPETAGNATEELEFTPRRPRRRSRAAGLLLTLAALGLVVAVSLGVAAAGSSPEDVSRLIAPAESPTGWLHRA